MAEKTNYANLKVTEEDHAQIDSAISQILEHASWEMKRRTISDLLDCNPANPNEVVACFPLADSSVVSSAFAQAYVAQRELVRLPHVTRIAIMRQFAANVEARLYRFIAAMVLEAGKARAEAKAEACESVELIRYYCNCYEAAGGYTVSMATSAGAQYCTAVSRPLGVFAMISPFNFPLALATGMCAGALLTGNAVVWKPSTECPLTALLLHDAFLDACAHHNIPMVGAQVFGLTVCADNVFERALAQSRDLIAGLAFTGSKRVGFHLKRLLDNGEPAVKIIAELGGKNYCIVTPNVRSLEAMARGVARSAFGYAGQKCSACSVLLVPEGMKRDAIAAVAKAAEEQFVMGDPRDHDATLGPLINARAYKRYQSFLERLPHDCATVVPKIKRKHYDLLGYYAEPIIVSGLPDDHPLYRDELFLPALCIRTYTGGISDAVEIANSTQYGLTAGFFSASQEEIEYFLEHMEAGVLYVNREAGATTGAWPGEQAFGGWKNSGIMTQFGVCGPDYLRNFMRSQSHTVYQ